MTLPSCTEEILKSTPEQLRPAAEPLTAPGSIELADQVGLESEKIRISKCGFSQRARYQPHIGLVEANLKPGAQAKIVASREGFRK
jgi:hypothetical protein